MTTHNNNNNNSTERLGVVVEIRAAEGGADAKLLVEDQVSIYGRLADQRGL